MAARTQPPQSTPFPFEVTGEHSDLVLEGGAMRGFQSGRLALVLNGDLQSIDEGEVAAMPSEAANVAALYAALRDDISSGGATVPDFEHAVWLAKLVEDALASAQSGTRTRAVDWPI